MAPSGPQAGRKRAGCAWLLGLLLAGCANRAADRSIDPVAWWHNLEGGPIADQRPPPPGADLPYPNLAEVPPKPQPIDPAMRASLSASLEADRANAAYETSQDPLAAAPPRAANGLFAAAKPLSAPDPDAAGASLDAAEAPPAPPAPVLPAPVPRAHAPAAAKPLKPVASTASPVLNDQPIPDTVVDNTPLPTIPDAPPAQPHLPDVVIPVTIPHLPPIVPPPPPPIHTELSAADAAPLAIAFPPGSAIVPLQERPALLALAFRRGDRGIEIIGFGEAEQADPQAQLDGVRLGLARARAVATVLVGDGSAMAGLRLEGNAPGRGAAARLVD